jgi:MFS family permease
MLPKPLSATRNVLALLCLMYFITYVDRVNVSTAATAFKEEFGLSNTQVGFVFSAFAYPYLIFQIIGGWLGDRFGAKQVLVLALLAQALGALGYLVASDLGTFYAVAAVFGFIYAGTMPLYAAIARENFPLRMMGTVIGGTAMAGSLGMATGPLAGGLIYDTLASYTWLYLGSAGMGLGAFLIAMTFRPFPKEQKEQAAPLLQGAMPRARSS